MAEETKAATVYSNRKKLDASVPLFLNDGHELEVEEESCCSAHSTLVSDQNTTFTAVKLHGKVMTLKGAKLETWPSSTEVACWYDTYPFSTVPIPLPHHYDQQKKAFVIYGNVCSVQCALAYMHRESRRHDLWERVVLFEDMMHKVFKQKIVGCEPAPPFLTLTRFGGFFSIEEYRASFNTVTMTVITPPFLMYPLVIQEKHGSTREVIQDETVLSTGHVLRGLRRPQKTTTAATAATTTVSAATTAASAPLSTPTQKRVTTPSAVRKSIKATTSAPLTVPALSESSSEESEVPALMQAQEVPPLSSLQADNRPVHKNKGRGRGRQRQTAPSHPISQTMLTNFLINK